MKLNKVIIEHSISILFLLFIFFSSFLYVSCKKDDGTPPTVIPELSNASLDDNIPSKSIKPTPKFDYVLSIFEQASCSKAGCHLTSSPKLRGREDAYRSLVNKQSRFDRDKILVVPWYSKSSYLLNKHTRLREYLSDAQIDIVKKWIDGGAKKD